MAEITAALVKELREKSGAGMMDCKKALAENNGDLDAAVDWLRKKGLASAAKKSGRAATEGLVAVAVNGSSGVVVEVNAETDFVARNEQFQAFVGKLAKKALEAKGDIEALKAENIDGKPAQDQLTELVATIGENMTMRRLGRLSVDGGVVSSYIHNALSPNLGKIGVLVALKSGAADKEKLQALGRQLAMHVAAARPEALDVKDLDPALIERERNVIADQARASGKPEEIVQKMLEGRLRKYYEEVVLLNQVYVVDGESKVADVIARAAKELGSPVELTGYVRFQLGEGLEKKEDDFASEVAKMAG